MRIINALGTAYASIVLFDLEKDKVEMIKTSGDTSMPSGDQILSKKIQQNHINEMLTSEYREGFLEFIDMDTVAQRLKGQQSLTYTSQMEKGTWLLSVIRTCQQSEDKFPEQYFTRYPHANECCDRIYSSGNNAY